MTEEELKEIMKKDLDGVFDVKPIIDFHFDLLQKAYVKGLNTGLKAGKSETIKSVSTEILLKELKDRGVIRSWYYNGTYHVGNELPK